MAEYRKNKQDARRARQEEEQAELDELQQQQDEEEVCSTYAMLTDVGFPLPCHLLLMCTETQEPLRGNRVRKM